jgi:uncharacterized membrane protein YgcG
MEIYELQNGIYQPETKELIRLDKIIDNNYKLHKGVYKPNWLVPESFYKRFSKPVKAAAAAGIAFAALAFSSGCQYLEYSRNEGTTDLNPVKVWDKGVKEIGLGVADIVTLDYADTKRNAKIIEDDFKNPWEQIKILGGTGKRLVYINFTKHDSEYPVQESIGKTVTTLFELVFDTVDVPCFGLFDNIPCAFGRTMNGFVETGKHTVQWVPQLINPNSYGANLVIIDNVHSSVFIVPWEYVTNCLEKEGLVNYNKLKPIEPKTDSPANETGLEALLGFKGMRAEAPGQTANATEDAAQTQFLVESKGSFASFLEFIGSLGITSYQFYVIANMSNGGNGTSSSSSHGNAGSDGGGGGGSTPPAPVNPAPTPVPFPGFSRDNPLDWLKHIINPFENSSIYFILRK